MKKWKVIVISVAAVAAVLAVGGSLFYNYYIVPKYINPLVDRVSTYLKDDKVIEELYDEAERLHEDGVIEDDTYSDFMRAYKKHESNNEESAKEVLEAADEEDYEEEENADSSVTARYASNKVGVEIIKTNDGSSTGKSNMTYSSERTSDRVKAEDVVEAEKVLDNTEEPVVDENDSVDKQVESGYEILKNNMSSDEYSAFVSIMRKLDIDTLMSYASDKEQLKAYLHSRLTDEEYSNIVNLGYKYAYLFMQ